MAELAGVGGEASLGAIDGSGVGSSPTAGTTEVHQLAARDAVNQTGAVEAAQEHVVYNCRMCRRAVFNADDIESHEPAQHNFHRRKARECGWQREGGSCSCLACSFPPRLSLSVSRDCQFRFFALCVPPLGWRLVSSAWKLGAL